MWFPKHGNDAEKHMNVIWFALVLIVTTQTQDPANLTGNAERGKALFTTSFKCASCHGSTGESGSPRLVPMRRTQADFIRFVQKPTVNAMPAFGDQTPQALADVYAYIKSIPERTPPPVQNIPILNDVLKTIP
jgi:mono/diheme cytochrome c family protein